MNMKPGSIYAAFHSKEQLYSSAMQSYFEVARDAFREEMSLAASPLTGLADLLRTYAQLPSDHPERQICMLMKTIIDTQTTEPALSHQAKEHLGAIRTEIAAVFEDARKKGEIPVNSDCNRLAQRFQANLNALRVELHQSIEGQDLKPLAEDMAQEVQRLRV